MKSSFKIIVKLCLITYLLCLTPFFSELPNFINLDQKHFTSSIYESNITDQKVSIKDQLNLMKVNKNVTLSSQDITPIKIETGNYVDNSLPKVDTVVPKVTNGKRVYIYNTHQQEGYSDGKSVVDASVLLANKLQEEGIQVVYETNDFPTYLRNHGLDYNSSYKASYFYLNEALVNYGGFDLVIDFHRDSVPRESSYVNIDNKNYARMMFVVGGLGKNAPQITMISNQLTDLVNGIKNGVMKNPMAREAYYNQEVTDKSILVEVGSDNNPFEEISNSTNLLAQAIIQYLR